MLDFAGNGSWVLNGRGSWDKSFPKFIKISVIFHTLQKNSIKFKSLQK